MDTWEALGLLTIGRRKTFRAGEVLMVRGPASSQAALITRGLVKVTAETYEDDVTFLTIRGDGDLIGEEGAVLESSPQADAGRPYFTVVTALTQVTAQVFAVEQLRDLLQEHPAAMFSVARGLCERLADAEARIASAARDNADRRLARLLCDLGRYGIPDRAGGREGTAIPVRLTQAELASWIGASRETVDRVLRGWRARGIVVTSYRKIIVTDALALARVAGVDVSRRPAGRPGSARVTGHQVTVDGPREKQRHRAAG